MAPDLRERLDMTLETAFEGNADPTHRRIVAAILAVRLSRQTVTTSTGARVCTRPVPAGLYWLFLHDRDTHVPAPDAPCPPGTDETVSVTGVWGREAADFVSWLNTITTDTGQTKYRIPTREELSDEAVSGALAPHLTGPRPVTCLWVHPADTAAPGRWLPPGQQDPHQITDKVLQDAVTEDTSATQVLSLLQLTTAALLAHALARALAHAHALDLALAGYFARDRALDLIRALDLALAGDIALARALALDRDLAGDLARDLDRDLDRARDLDRRRDAR
jgi:hypothetical protein